MFIHSALKIGNESVPETLENFYTSMLLPTQEDFVRTLLFLNNNYNNNIIGTSQIIRKYCSLKVEP